MDVQAVITQARDALTVDRVFGQPYERNGVTVFPVATVRGGGGGGGGPTGGGGGGIQAGRRLRDPGRHGPVAAGR